MNSLDSVQLNEINSNADNDKNGNNIRKNNKYTNTLTCAHTHKTYTYNKVFLIRTVTH